MDSFHLHSHLGSQCCSHHLHSSMRNFRHRLGSFSEVTQLLSVVLISWLYSYTTWEQLGQCYGPLLLRGYEVQQWEQ